MKIKKIIGTTVNGFTVLDTYVKITQNGKKTRKVLLQCEKCGKQFERQSGVDFEHIKCKCMCKPKPESKYHYVEYEGKTYTVTDICRIKGIKVNTFCSRLKNGIAVEDALKNEHECKCKTCGAAFVSHKINAKFCSANCAARFSHLKLHPNKDVRKVKCVVCGHEFDTNRYDAKTCSVHCRQQLARIERNKRYKHLRNIGEFDESVTLENVFNKFNGICTECNKQLSFDGDFKGDDYPSIDHIIPLSKGGVHKWDNVQLLCRKCNCKKAAKISEV